MKKARSPNGLWKWAMVALSSSLFLSIPALARQSATRGVESDPQSAPHSTAGIVLAVDAHHARLSVEEASYQGSHLSFTLAPDARIEKDGKAIALTDVSVGDPVSVDYRTQGQKKIVTEMTVLTEPPS